MKMRHGIAVFAGVAAPFVLLMAFASVRQTLLDWDFTRVQPEKQAQPNMQNLSGVYQLDESTLKLVSEQNYPSGLCL